MTNNDELALRLKSKASLALEAWNKLTSLPDDVELERGMSLDEMTLIFSHNAASNPANVLSLLAERDADKKRIAELEARTVSVKCPKAFTKSIYGTALYEHDDIVAMLAAAGIKLEVGE